MKSTSQMTYDVQAVRRDFPILKNQMRGKPFIYLDNGATSLKPQVVIDEIVRYYTTMSANIHRGVYEFSETATLAYDAARASVAELIKCPADGQVIFTHGTTESVNMVMYGWARTHIGTGDTVLTTEMEHHSNLVPLQELCKQTGATLEFIPIDGETGTLDLSHLDELLTPRTKLVAITAMSNVTGYMPPLARIIEAAHEAGARVLVDGAQYVSHHPTDVGALDCDFLVFSGHKMCGPTGVGALYGKLEALEEMTPFLYGGDMIQRVKKDSATYNTIPERFEAGTPNIAGVLGMGKACEYLRSIGMGEINAHEQELVRYALERTKDYPGLTVYGPADSSIRGGIFSFNIDDVHPHDAGAILDMEGIAVRTGFHCAQPYMKVLGTFGTVRASFYLYNTTDEIDKLVDSLSKVKEMFA